MTNIQSLRYQRKNKHEALSIKGSAGRLFLYTAVWHRSVDGPMHVTINTGILAIREMSLTNKNYWKEEKLTFDVWECTKTQISKSQF